MERGGAGAKPIEPQRTRWPGPTEAPPLGARPRPRRPRAGREEAGRRGPAPRSRPAPRSHGPAASGATRSCVLGTWGRREVSAVDRRGGAGLSAAGHRRRKGPWGRARTRLRARRAAAEGARPAERSGPTWAKPEAKGQGWTRTVLRDQVCRPLGLSSDKTPKGSLGNESPAEGTGRLGRSLKPREEERGLPRGSTVQPSFVPEGPGFQILPSPLSG